MRNNLPQLIKEVMSTLQNPEKNVPKVFIMYQEKTEMKQNVGLVLAHYHVCPRC